MMNKMAGGDDRLAEFRPSSLEVPHLEFQLKINSQNQHKLINKSSIL
ncbi:MAG: hypothetical protein LDL41_04095 [Coleofasciculus sp. S288]|nr:hypothetical protein [Coleofasciculus sp. S288]